MLWQKLIQDLNAFNMEMHEIICSGSEPFIGPCAGADSSQLLAFERKENLQLDPDHKDFLTYANGWPAFSGIISLLGTADYAGSSLFQRGKNNLGYISNTALGSYRKKRKQLFIIGASDANLDVICMPMEAGKVQKTVIWFNNVEPEEFEDFPTYFRRTLSSMPMRLDYLRSTKNKRS